MHQRLTMLSRKMSSFITSTLKTAFHEDSQQDLARHIVSVNRQSSESHIVNETAVSLSAVLGCRMAAFIFEKDGLGADVWTAPALHCEAMEKMIQSQVRLQDKTHLNYFKLSAETGTAEVLVDKSNQAVNIDELLHQEIEEENCACRMYFLPPGKKRPYSDEMLGLIFQSCSSSLSRLQTMQALKQAAVRDALTGCYNRREFESQLQGAVSGALRHKTPLSVFMFDLDHFKQVNDTYGHQAGDKVLQEVAHEVRSHMRSGDVLARYGGEEFIAILPATNKRKAMELADRLRGRIAEKDISFNGKTIQVTASFGVSELNRRHPDKGLLVRQADTMLYKAKYNGRNTVMPGLFKVIPRMVCQTV